LLSKTEVRAPDLDARLFLNQLVHHRSQRARCRTKRPLEVALSGDRLAIGAIGQEVAEEENLVQLGCPEGRVSLGLLSDIENELFELFPCRGHALFLLTLLGVNLA